LAAAFRVWEANAMTGADERQVPKDSSTICKPAPYSIHNVPVGLH
jgi:hypothetical protein